MQLSEKFIWKKVREGKRRYSFQQHEHKIDKKSICIFLKQE